MKVQMRARQARKLAEQLYPGDSKPISKVAAGDYPLKIEWWESQPQNESPDTERQMAGMLLYLELAAKSKPQLPHECFPAQFDCEGESLRPDKAIIKAFLREGLIIGRMLGWQLVFDLTNAGREYAQRSATALCLQ